MSGEKSESKRGRPRKANPEAILDVAMRAYWAAGAEVSVNKVCELAGVSKPSLYRDFGCEDGLMAETLQRYAEMVQAELSDLLKSELSFSDKLEGLVRFVSEDPRNAQGCLFFKMRAARSQLGPQTQAKLRQIETATVELYGSFFKQYLMAGDWRGKVTPEFAARYLYAQLGLAVSQRALGVEDAEVKLILEHALSVL